MKNKTVTIVCVVLAFFVGIAGTMGVYRLLPESILKETVTKSTISVKEQNDLKDAINKIYDAVVLIESYKNGIAVSTGTGFVYKKEKSFGYVMTNNHVVNGADEVKIKDIQGNTIDAKIVGGDDFSDIAVLTIDEKAVLQVAEIGDSTASELGDTLFTVGSPLGEEYMGTVTKGILSGKNRSVDTGDSVMEVLQTDAAMNPGNSGGPLVNIAGQVIGVNSLKLVENEIEGMGFAIPIELALSTAEKIEKGEKIVRPLVGVQLTELSNAYYLYRNGILVDPSIKEGIVVASVQENTPAEKAGLKPGDVITQIGDTKVTSVSKFRSALYKYNIGDKVKIKIIRVKDEKELTLHLNQKSE